MSQWRPCRRLEFIRRLRTIGFAGPYSGTKHQFLIYQRHRLTVPSNAQYSVPQLRMMVREVERITARLISSDEWNLFGKE